MNKRLEKGIDIILNEIKSESIGIVKNGKISSQYNGYIASFGASIIQNGLIPAVMLFENSNSNSEKERSLLMKLILEGLLKLYNKYEEIEKKETLIEYIVKNKEKFQEKDINIRKDIETMATAIKLVIRTYELGDN